MAGRSTDKACTAALYRRQLRDHDQRGPCWSVEPRVSGFFFRDTLVSLNTQSLYQKANLLFDLHVSETNAVTTTVRDVDQAPCGYNGNLFLDGTSTAEAQHALCGVRFVRRLKTSVLFPLQSALDGCLLSAARKSVRSSNLGRCMYSARDSCVPAVRHLRRTERAPGVEAVHVHSAHYWRARTRIKMDDHFFPAPQRHAARRQQDTVDVGVIVLGTLVAGLRRPQTVSEKSSPSSTRTCSKHRRSSSSTVVWCLTGNVTVTFQQMRSLEFRKQRYKRVDACKVVRVWRGTRNTVDINVDCTVSHLGNQLPKLLARGSTVSLRDAPGACVLASCEPAHPTASPELDIWDHDFKCGWCASCARGFFFSRFSAAGARVDLVLASGRVTSSVLILCDDFAS